MSMSVSSLVLSKNRGSGVCKDFDTGGQLPYQNQLQSQLYCPCFTPGTKIKTDQGETLVEDITMGSRVLTRDNGYQKVVWSGKRRLSRAQLAQMPSLKPIRIAKDTLGSGVPECDTEVSPQHRILLRNAQIADYFSKDEVLVAAHLLTCFQGIDRSDADGVDYIHFMFEQHEIVLSNGLWTESYQPSNVQEGSMDERHRAELLMLFPELAETDDTQSIYPAARAVIEPNAFSQILAQRA